MDDFTIDRVSWHTQRQGNTEPREKTIQRFFVFADFLQRNGLTVRDISRPEATIDDAFEIRSSDLTPEGLSLVKIAYDKWLRRVDRGMDPSKLSIFEKALADLRNGAS
jgi:hypothetical protein